MATRPIRRVSSRAGTSGNRDAQRIYTVPVTAFDQAHTLSYEQETRRYNPERTRVICSCGKYTSSWWADAGRAKLAGAAHCYAMTFPAAHEAVDRPENFTEVSVDLAYGTCYIHGEESPCGCLRGCAGCTGCICYCDCVGG